MDDWGPVPSKCKDFSLHHHIQTSSGAHSTSYPMGDRGSFPGSKVGVSHETDYSPPSSAEVKLCGVVPPLSYMSPCHGA